MSDNPIGGFIALIILLMIYFAPAICASDKKYSSGIFILNLFLGWTLIGWVAALIWAVSSPLKEAEKLEAEKES